jgi:hypothetical protein
MRVAMLDEEGKALLWYLTDSKRLLYFYIENAKTRFT